VRLLLLLFLVVPLLELYLLLWIGRLIGWWPTVALTVVTGTLGGALARREGLRVWRAWRAALDRLEPPAEGVVEGILVLVGGALLITPGVLTDVAGFALMVPWTRRHVAVRVRGAIDRRIRAGTFQVSTFGGGIPRAGSDGIVETTGKAVEEDARTGPGAGS
jgi:UPF0716 protein FxsA